MPEELKTKPVKTFLVGSKEILSVVARWAIQQSPYIPINLEIMLNKIKDALQATPEFMKAEKDNFGFLETDRDRLRPWLQNILFEIPEFMDMNLSAYEKAQKIKVDDPTRDSFVATSRYWKIKSEHDFVDVYALVINVCISLEEYNTKN